MSGNITHAYAASITKAEKTSDGHLMVHGKAAGPELDLDGQICDPAWLKAAMPDWHRWGNIRAQHGPVAAGVGKELVEDGHSWMLTAKVVDADAKLKVEEGVYKGFSIGVKNARVIRDNQAPKGRIVAGDIVEISLVDRPANPYATLAICKSAGLGSMEPVDADGVILKAGLLEADIQKRARAVVDGVLEGDLLKDLEEGGDVEQAWEAIRCVATLIQSEAEGLKQGNAHEIRDIEELLRAVECLKCFIDREEGEEGDHDYPDMAADMAAYKALLLEEEAGVRAEITKAILADVRKGLPPLLQREDDEDDDEDDESGDEDDEGAEKTYMSKVAGATLDQLLTKVAGLEADLQTATENSRTSAAEVEALKAELKKFAGTAIPGGPRLVAPSHVPYRPEPVSDAERYRLMSQAPNLAPDVAAGLRELAAREEGLAVS